MTEDIQEETQEETEQSSRPRIGRRDFIAGLILGVESIPDAMASAILAGVNPIHGLYAVMLSTPVGALFASSVFMSVQTTSALSLIVFDVAAVHRGEEGIMALFTLAILTGVFMVVFGLLRLGSLLRFVPHAVMTGFINGIAVLIILGQLGDFTGYDSLEGNKVMQAIDLISNFREIQIQTLAVGMVTILLILFLNGTRMKQFSFILALILGSALVPLFGWSVLQVADVSSLPDTLPRPIIPDLSFVPTLILPALSIAIVGLVQGAGISQSYPNPDGKYPDTSRDFVGQGAANVAAGIFRGMPVGGSLSATSLVISSGARSRMANIAAGIVIAIAVIVFGSFIEALAMPALAGLLIVIGFQTLKPHEAERVWKTGALQQLTMTATFVGTLIMPLQYAVFLGVVLSLFLFVVNQSNELKVYEWEIKEGEFPIEKPAPDELLPEKIVVLIPMGSLFFAAAPIFEEKLPALDKAYRSVLIISLRGYDTVGSTFLSVLEKYEVEMTKCECKLILAEVNDELWAQLSHTGHLYQLTRDQVYTATDKVAESVYIAYADAEKWVNEG